MKKILEKQLINFNIQNYEEEVFFQVHLNCLKRFQTLLSEKDGIIQFYIKIFKSNLYLKASNDVFVFCQRCLNETNYKSKFDEIYHLSYSKNDENEDDVLIIDNKINLLEILEDELILSIDIAPKCNFDCNQFLKKSINKDDEPKGDTYRPFAQLLKK